MFNDNQNNSPILLLSAWVSHGVAHFIQNIDLKDVSFIFSILSSMTYIYITFKPKKDDKQINS